MQLKGITVIMILLCLVTISGAQITDAEKKLKEQNTDSIHGWKTGGVTALNLAQTTLTNWAAGGQKSLAMNGILSLFAKYKKDKNFWDNSLDLGYGFLKQDDKINSFMKTDDKVDFLSKYGREAFKKFYYAALINFKTQMRPGYNYPNDSNKISDLLAPAYLIGALGMDFKPSNSLSAFAAPITGKLTFVNDQKLADNGAFGVDPAILDSTKAVLVSGKNRKTEIGGYLRIIYSKNDFKYELLKNFSFTTKIDFFSNYLHNPQNIDISWETLIAIKVNKYVSVNINTHLLYDDDTKIAIDDNKDGIAEKHGSRIQFKEILGIGFSYNF